MTRSIHHERMPVLLSGEDQFETWLSGSPAEAFALAKSLDPVKTAAWRETNRDRHELFEKKR